MPRRGETSPVVSERIDQAVRLMRSGMTVTETSKEIGVTVPTVYYYLDLAAQKMDCTRDDIVSGRVVYRPAVTPSLEPSLFEPVKPINLSSFWKKYNEATRLMKESLSILEMQMAQ